MADPQSGRNFGFFGRRTLRIPQTPPEEPRRADTPPAFRTVFVRPARRLPHVISGPSVPDAGAPSPRFGPQASRVRAAPQPAAEYAASSADPQVLLTHIGTPASHLPVTADPSNSRPRRAEPASANPLAALCLETHQTRPFPRNHRSGRVRTRVASAAPK